jgi:hypothetical protein
MAYPSRSRNRVSLSSTRCSSSLLTNSNHVPQRKIKINGGLKPGMYSEAAYFSFPARPEPRRGFLLPAPQA